MSRALWKGAISFGLVSIPVDLYSAENRKALKFAMLDKRDFAPVGYKRYNKRSGKEVAWEDVVKAYEYRKDDYVVLSDEDFRRANVKATQTIDIQTFVPAREIPPAFFETPYFLVPGRRSAKVYALLRETLRAGQQIAIAQVVIRTRQHLAAVLVNGRALMLNTLRYADEFLPARDLDLPAQGSAAGVTAKEVELAQRLVDDMSGHWKPAEFKDTYHEDLMARVEEKVELGQTREITAKTAVEPAAGGRSAKVIDLAELLRQSIARGDADKGRGGGGRSTASAKDTNRPARSKAAANGGRKRA